MKLLTNVHIYTVNRSNEQVREGYLLINEGKIEAIGQQGDEGYQQYVQLAEVIDGGGAILTPGLIDIHTHVGLWGETTGDTSDGNEASSPYTPVMHAVDAINPQHISFQDARMGGVTTVQTGAGSGNPIAGVWSIVKTKGEVVEDMLLREYSALKGALGENPKGLYGQRQRKSPFTRMSTADWIRKGFRQASILLEEGKTSTEELLKQNRYELWPFIDVLKGKMPLRLHAHRADDIVTAIRIAKEFNVNLSIEHCTEGFKVVDYLAEQPYSVTLGPFMGFATKFETKDMNLANPRILHEKGVHFAIITDHPFVPIQYLHLCAAEAVKHGLDEDTALRSITIHPAQIGGIDARVGSIEVGKDADFVLWQAHPFSLHGKVLSTWINGEKVFSDH